MGWTILSSAFLFYFWRKHANMENINIETYEKYTNILTFFLGIVCVLICIFLIIFISVMIISFVVNLIKWAMGRKCWFNKS